MTLPMYTVTTPTIDPSVFISNNTGSYTVTTPPPSYSIYSSIGGGQSWSAVNIDQAFRMLQSQLDQQIKDLQTRLYQTQYCPIPTPHAPRTPLTQTEIEQIIDAVSKSENSDGQLSIWDGPEKRLARAIERAHGIT